MVALGFLSFLDLNFFKTQLRAKIAFAVGLAFLFATEAMFLTSSGAGRYLAGLRLDVTDCEMEVEEAFPLERGKHGPVISDNIKACMDGSATSGSPTIRIARRPQSPPTPFAICRERRSPARSSRFRRSSSDGGRFETPAIARGAALP